MAFWKRNRYWIAGISAIGVLVWILARLNVMQPISLTGLLGVAGLAFTLIPSNLLKLKFSWPEVWRKPIARIAAHKRDFGITSGLTLCLHAALNIQTYTMFRLDILKAFLFSKPIIPALVAIGVLLLMLLTSSLWSQRKLGRNWKPLHSLIWFVIPIAAVHVYLASTEYVGVVPIPAMSALALILLFCLCEALLGFMAGDRDWKHYRHLWFVLAGSVVATILFWK